MFEIGIDDDDLRSFFDGRGNGKGICIRDGVAGLDPGSVNDLFQGVADTRDGMVSQTKYGKTKLKE
jgi:hypothetical protein